MNFKKFLKIKYPIFLLLCCVTASCQNKKLVTISTPAQLILVRSPTATSTSATLQRFEKKRKAWKPVGNAVQVSLGRTGLAWGSGDAVPKANEPLKREGDGKSPAGTFSFGKVFGYAPASEVSFKMPYVHATDALECVDDSNSRYYNQLVDNTTVQKDWTSSERISSVGHQYRWGIMVNHNTPAQPQGGSCIFLHIWKEPGAPTSGCTAMTEADLLELLHWLDPAKSPRLLQVVEADYPVFQKEMGLPE